MGLAADILQIARRTADDNGGGCLESVSVIVGDLAAVEPDLLGFAWQALVGASPDAGARLEVNGGRRGSTAWPAERSPSAPRGRGCASVPGATTPWP